MPHDCACHRDWIVNRRWLHALTSLDTPCNGEVLHGATSGASRETCAEGFPRHVLQNLASAECTARVRLSGSLLRRLSCRLSESQCSQAPTGHPGASSGRRTSCAQTPGKHIIHIYIYIYIYTHTYIHIYTHMLYIERERDVFTALSTQ